ncbi:MAG TPA: peptide MFS transporter [Vicinamibacterales bacterium]|nr:peptide MFS transporter [Vicinamibacterales bacterium]
MNPPTATGAARHTDVTAAASSDTSFFGHPRGLSTLFFTEMWERFSYYGMRGFLILYMTASAATGGMGLDVATAAAIYGTYTSLVYLMSVPGGWLADRVLGQRKAVLYGGILIAAGHYTLAVPAETAFYVGLVLIVLGTGLLKPNISAIVGQLYAPTDIRRDAAFSIFYMGINMGAFFGPLVTGFLAQDARFRAMIEGWGFDPNSTWHFAFGAAGVGMTFGLLQYVLAGRAMGSAGITPGGATTPALVAKYRQQAFAWGGAAVAGLAVLTLLAWTGSVVLSPELIRNLTAYSLLAITVVFFATLFLDRSWTREERGRLWVVFIFFVCAALFWSVFEQAGSTLNLFADRSTRNEFFGSAFPSSWFQSLNALFIVAFAPLFAWMWVKLGSRQPASPTKFGIGLIGVALGFILMIPAAQMAASGGKVSPMWLTSVYLVHTFAELCLSPVGLSSMTKLAPARVVGSMMGVWFLGASVGNFIAGQLASFYEEMPLQELLAAVSVLPILAGIVMLAFSKRFTKMMSGVK